MLDKAFIIPFLPLAAFIAIVFFTNRREKLSAGLAIGAVAVAWVMSIVCLIEMLGYHGEGAFQLEQAFDIVTFQNFRLELGVLLDPLTALMLIVVTTVSLMVHIYSLGYMHGDIRFSRFFAYLALFTFAMLGLVLANNFFLIFIFWELVGLTSYLLIGFWYEKKSAADAGKKAFITTKIGDLGFTVGILMMGMFLGTFNYIEVFDKIAAGQLSGGVLTTMAILIFCGAVGKSAQVPLHVWLPDAMEGPTPVSALIHAATMVAAGVFLVARSMTIFMASPDGAMVVAVIGMVTSIFAASIALVQNDIKRILAYSTLSQLGYMIMALGLGGYTAGMFHLMTHAFFKALLFLGAGSVIHAVHTNDIQEMGGLSRKMKITTVTFIIASLSISGIFPLSGFWSKDEIIATASHQPIFLIVSLLVAFMTAFYMFRLCFLTFSGTPRNQHAYDHAHESPRSMTWPLMFLAVLSVVAGWVGIPWLSHGFSSFVYHGEPHHVKPEIILMVASTVVALLGIGLAYLMYYRGAISPQAMGARFKPLYTLLYHKYYVDEFYDAVIIKPVFAATRFLWKFDAKVIDGFVNLNASSTLRLADIKNWFDIHIVDGIVNGLGLITGAASSALRLIQTGRLAHYLLAVLFGLIMMGLLSSSNLLNWILWQIGLQ
ncbi:MAG: NADH-quinone oxidoreductase subunit L [candidate division Zixibacteria bacterium]|nr:NADH-quinone oxidoreductase subunit L [candidate division Zixibacteria bacterium]